MKKKLTFIIAILAAFPGIAQANNSIAQATGISDLSLLVLMSSFILLLLLIIKALASAIKGISKGGNWENKEKKTPSAKAMSLILLVGLSQFAQAAETTPKFGGFTMSNGVFWMLLSLIVILSIVIFVLFRALKTLIKLESGLVEEEEETVDIFEQLKLTDQVPIEEESSVMLDHEYDGIRELDNNLPPWWVYLFYATILFGVIYLIRFHITGDGKLSHEEYAIAMQKATEEKAAVMAEAADAINEDNVVYLLDAPSIDKGAAIFKGNCATCHGQLGEGGAGPNLTDAYWIHGGGAKNIFKTIKYGVPEKGMIAWQSQFSPKQMQQLASYINTLQNTNPPGAKAPQGEIYVETIELSDSSDQSIEVDSVTIVAEQE